MLFSRLAVVSSSLLLVLAVHAVSQRPCKLYVPPKDRVDQGCIHQGNDRRLAGPVVCWLQRQLSWKAEREPRLSSWGEQQRRFVALAWPPYVVYDSPDGYGHWRMFRAGFRYDRKWRGYIFPTAACKCLSKPVIY
ncbi:MAG TPA: hypothetical protein VJP04_11975 [Terriglobales bacterium]|nr:hypothetical protein [Terriglobales bacterium]